MKQQLLDLALNYGPDLIAMVMSAAAIVFVYLKGITPDTVRKSLALSEFLKVALTYMGHIAQRLQAEAEAIKAKYPKSSPERLIALRGLEDRAVDIAVEELKAVAPPFIVDLAKFLRPLVASAVEKIVKAFKPGSLS